jgi:hypothetical protein
MQTVYIETSVVSFLRENLSASPESVERQLLTRRWWSIYRHRYELVTSQYVVDEARVGQADRAQERLGYLAGVPLLSLSDEVDALAAEIMTRAILPKDALVLGAATVVLRSRAASARARAACPAGSGYQGARAARAARRRALLRACRRV